mmetsp:Transcript_28902/g.67204  ORF Transcript_28902/g.67204 Transcript_28902/m.67204 type:complete len:443 (+) Transcript_28902:111-1439(+)|eukprot:CAMPEP_0119504638 /NCGR_PEP_ID=MMETSP1344-20130328/25436_1 /TAXON_ID=236787 /ORGANISM="Florenciella parvula, Strain CCMP2471" /LENGTH=442 /DNA_ID=CAMNT_0007541033 /DNA_START=77 /DNA_END=1405 /DNA_ORIENTATION=+
MAAEQKDADIPSTAEHDLTNTISAYLDLHLMFPLLEFVEVNKLLKYDRIEVQKARLALLKPTNMVDYAIEIHQDIAGTEDTPADMATQRDEVYEKMGRLESENKTLETFFADKDAVRTLEEQGSLNLEYLASNNNVTPEALDNYYRYAKFKYDCGDYETANTMLTDYLRVEETKSVTTTLGFNAQWGKFGAEILLKNWDKAMAEMNTLKKAIEDRDSSDKEQLQQRTWLLHWSLFVFFNHPKGKDLIIDTFFAERHIQAIQTNAPWLLRYLTAAVIINKRRRNELKSLVRVIQQEQYTYSDPLTKFLECLYVNFDFEGAQEKLHECKLVLQSDYFLCNSTDEFMENARLFIFETYCRIHQKIDISMLAQKLAMESEDAERWIVNLIRGAYLDAKIDSNHGTVIMGSNFPTVYQQVIDKTKDLTIRSYQLAANIERHTLSGAL